LLSKKSASENSAESGSPLQFRQDELTTDWDAVRIAQTVSCC